jgi:hypothetical protein
MSVRFPFRRSAGTPALALCAALAFAPALAAAQTAAIPSPIEPEAKKALDRMAAAIQKAGSLSVVADLSWDSVQPDGQKLEFGETRRYSIRRPDRLRVETDRRNGEKRGTVYDGKEIAVYDFDQKAFASLPKTGTLDEAIDYARDDLGVRVPLGELFSSDLSETLAEDVREATLVDDEQVGGVECEHVALRTDGADMQIWIAKGEPAVPRRIVITYRNEIGQPQFRADLRDWNLAAQLPDTLFSIAQPAGSERVPLRAPTAAPTEGGQ